jgi:hypothetical protein
LASEKGGANKSNQDIHNSTGTLGSNFWEYAASSKQKISIKIDYQANVTSVNPKDGKVTWNPNLAYTQAFDDGGGVQVATQSPAIRLFREALIAVHINLGAHFYEGSGDGEELLVDQPGYSCTLGSPHSGKVNFSKYLNYQDKLVTELVNLQIFDMSGNKTNLDEDRFLPGLPEQYQLGTGPLSRPPSTVR